MKNIKIIIGANYGDEGKGLATNYFAQQYKDKKTVVVLHNGGFQRGHTVIHNDIRHVFHCFSSGTFANAKTYYASTFILNPMFFEEEFNTLSSYGYKPIVLSNPNCRITTCFEVMINQIIEESRGNKRHGSCGYGIFETIKRHEAIPFTVKDALKMNNNEIANMLFTIREQYVFQRLEDLGLKNISIATLKNLFNNNIIYKYIEDLRFMLKNIIVKETIEIANFDNIIFEGSQGLLLDQENIGKTKHLTPSNTGLDNPAKIIKELSLLGFLDEYNLETCYISRTYLTRHGSGEFLEECQKEEINKNMFDKTNIPNDYQGSLRYGYLNIDNLLKRIKKDADKIDNNNYCLFITHLNETNNNFILKNNNLDIFNLKEVKYISKEEKKVEVI